MNTKRISAVALSNRDFDSFEDKLAEACRWVALAAGMGSELAVLPEAINLYCGDGPDNPRQLAIAEVALDDWQASCRSLLDCAVTHKIAVTIPIFLREGGRVLNCFYLVSKTGQVLGRYVKTHPTPGELDQGVVPGEAPKPIAWAGLKVGGAICFDMNFRELFDRQKADGVDLFLCPSLTPGGDQVNYYAGSLAATAVVAYPAWSRIINVLGHTVAQGGYRHETLRFGFGVPLYTADINFDTAVFHFDRNQQKIQAILRRYGSDVRIEFDQDNSRFALESRSANLTVKQMIEEFALQPIDEYFAEYRRILGAIDSCKGS